MTVEYHRPVPVGEDLRVEGWVDSRPDDRTAIMAAEIRDAAGTLLGSAKADFALFTREAFETLDLVTPDLLDALAAQIGA